MPRIRDQVLGLDDPAARDVAVVGAKAAGLARARAAGFAVLDGFVIPAAASVRALTAAAERLADGGSGAARLAVIRHPLDPALEDAMTAAAARLPAPLIVRSSSVLEGDGRWSGAFTSVPEVRVDEVPKAARSVWATCFSLDVLGRFEEAGLAPGSAPMAVLVQPEIVADFGGTATVDARGAVTVTAVKGSPRDLLAGWVPGARAVWDEGALAGQDALELVGGELLGQVVDLALRVHAEPGHNLIEWAAHRGRVVLLQVQSSALGVAPSQPPAIPAALAHPLARQLAVLCHRYLGALGEELVLGWLPGMVGMLGDGPEPFSARDISSGRRIPYAGGTVAEARALAAELTAQAWGEPAEQAVAHARLVLRRLRSDRPDESVAALRDLRPVDPAAAGRLLGMYEALAAAEDRDGIRPHRRGRDRWEPFLAGVAALQGEAHSGQPSVGGIGAGRFVWVDSPTRTDHVRPRDVVVAQYPLPNFSPLLWDAAGVVTVGGAPSAHLFEVARSLTVPAVVDCAIAEIVKARPRLGMVDGDTGRVALL